MSKNKKVITRDTNRLFLFLQSNKSYMNSLLKLNVNGFKNNIYLISLHLL